MTIADPRPLTDEQIRKAVTGGTTTYSDQVRVLWSDGQRALVKWPGGYAQRSILGDSWVSPWIEFYRSERDIYRRGGVEVYNCNLDKDGRLTKRKLATLVSRLGLDPGGIR